MQTVQVLVEGVFLTGPESLEGTEGTERIPPKDRPTSGDASGPAPGAP